MDQSRSSSATSAARPPLRVLRVLPMLATGGAEMQNAEVLGELATRQQHYGVAVELATFYEPLGRAPALPDGVRHHFLSSPRSLAGLRRAAGQLSTLIPQYDLVHALLWPAIWAVALARRGGVPFLASFFSTRQKPGPLQLKRLADAVLIRRASMVSTLSEESARFMEDYHWLPRGSVRIVPDGKRAYEGPALPREGLVAMMRTTPPKRYDLLLAALAQIPTEQRPLLRCFGYGTDSPEFRAQADSAAVSASIGFGGETSDPLSRMASAEALLLATEWEGLPNVVLEAWGCGTPVLASHVSGVRELIRDGVDGLLVDNTPAAWAAAIQRLRAEPELGSRLAAAGRERMLRDYRLEVCCERWCALYRELAGR